MFTLLAFSVFSWGILVISGAANLPVLAIFYVFFVKGASNLSITSNLYVFCVGGEMITFQLSLFLMFFWLGGVGLLIFPLLIFSLFSLF